MIPYGQQWISDDDIQEVERVLRSDWITTGPTVPVFEESLTHATGCRHAVCVNSGTSALDIAVQSLNAPAGSEVITTPLTFVATANACLYHGLVPVFADIDRETRNIDPREIRRRITEKTRAIIAVDFAGHPCEWDEIRRLADDHGLALIDDACHALGAEYRGRRLGTLADLTILSFHPVKHVTTGEGGAVLTEDPQRADLLRMLRSHGIDRNALARSGPGAGWAYDMTVLGRNYRMTDFQAALGISQLTRLDRFLSRRREIADRYTRAFLDLSHVEVPVTRPHVRHAWHIYTVLMKGIPRDTAFSALRRMGIGANVHYLPVYRFSYYRERFAISPAGYPVSEDVCARTLTLPLFPRMSDADVDTVISAVNSLPAETAAKES